MDQKKGHPMRHRTTTPRRRKLVRLFAVPAVIIVVAGIVTGVVIHDRSAGHSGPLPVQLPAATGSYLGVYTRGAPASYAGVRAFASATSTRPDVVMYYSGWYVPFPGAFATTAANDGAVPLVQMDPDGVSVAGIAHGRYDGYLSSYAEAVRAYRHPVLLSFGHEMNGDWYSWGYKHTSPAQFVAAWRHIVTLFRALGARNVTWLWTVNIINDTHGGNIPRPTQWWPGASYVNWVGIDGYYLKPNWKFAPLFGPTIAAVRKLTLDPILIAETGAVPAAGQPSKIGDLFSGVRHYGLLGFVWFDSTNSVGQQFGLESAAALAAFRRDASSYTRPG
jgi:mannan endo-1,4-beta-mannosidase